MPLGYSVGDFAPNCSLAAYGRIWVADIAGDPQTVYFTRLLDGSDFQGGDSGSLSLNAVFPNSDKIVAIAAHNGFLIIFGRNNIAVYANPIAVSLETLFRVLVRILSSCLILGLEAFNGLFRRSPCLCGISPRMYGMS
jgi:hypothetical protein